MSAPTRDLARALRDDLSDPWALVEKLGLLDGVGSYVRQAGGAIVRCPWHPDRSPSCSVRAGRDGTVSVRCHGCGQTGDALSLLAQVEGLDVRRDFRAVLARAAELAGRWDLAADLTAGRSPAMPTRPRRIVPPAPDRTYPPSDELEALLASTVDVAADRETSAMLRGRGLDPEWIDDARLARVIPADTALPSWARFRGRSWVDTGHRLVVPVVDPAGDIRSVRAWRIVEGETPKRLPPAGHRASGLVLADVFGVAMLRGTWRPSRVLVLEGEPDFLAACSRSWGHVLAARLGIGSGAWSDDLAAKIPDGAEVAIWTDADDPGDRYAAEMARSLRGRCVVTRARTGVAA